MERYDDKQKEHPVEFSRTRESARFLAAIVLAIVVLGPPLTGCEQAKTPTADGGVPTSWGADHHLAVSEVSGLTWQWRYDRDGRLSEIEAPGRVTTRVTYQERESKAGSEQTSTVDVGGEKRVFTRDDVGRLLNAQGSGGAVAIDYNRAGLPAEVRSSNAPTIRYGYDVQGRLTQARIGDGTAIGYRYDYLGRLAAITTPAGDIAYSYHRATNTVTRRLPNGVQTRWKYDDEGKLSEITHVDVKNVVIAKYAYAYRPDGLLEGIATYTQQNGDQACQYQYDLMQRLTDGACKGGKESHRFGYDSLGNLAESQAAGDQTLRFTSTPAGVLATDSRGEVQTDERGHIRRLPASAGPIEYTFNGAGELSSVAAHGQKVEYAYNALGLLTARKVGGRDTRYLPDPFADAWHPLWQRDAGGAETVTVWDGAVPLVALKGKDVTFRLEDHLGSVRVEVDSRGGVLAWHDYSPYGVREEGKSDGELSPGFAGLFWDPAAKVYHAMARAYDPVTARFLQPDPQLRVPGVSKHSHSLYAYAGGDPINFVDRNGAEAVRYETVTLDADATWRDAFLRAFDYHLASLDRRILGRADAPLVVNTDPKVRDSLIMEIYLYARRESGDDPELARQTVRNWRFKLSPRPEKYGGAWVTEAEWQAAADLAVAAQYVETGRAGTLLPPLPPGKLPALFVQEIGSRAWELIHYAGETFGEPPSSVYGAFGIELQEGIPDTWHPWTADTKRAVRLGIGVGLINLQRREGSHKTEAPGLPESQAPFPPAIDPRRLHEARQLTDVMMEQMAAARRAIESHDISGGDGRVAGPGGFASPQAYEALYEFQKHSLMAPSPVGGVSLRGAGKALEGLGQLKGIAVDEATGKLVLIGSDAQKLALPLLRLDDVVTVFRAVYNHGQSPSVTIDPDEGNPKGPQMHVKHGPGTDGTYVGWILFESDRIMKSYQLGKDNVTKQEVNSKVTGYADTVSAVFFSGVKQVSADDQNWERFWIVPAAVRRYDATKADLSLFEVPLKVNTQKMRMEVQTKGGQKVHTLVDDEKGKSSSGAIAFKTWFSERYDKIADEVRLTPPPGSGLEQPVAIFHELRRIALITAIAERLRDLGQPMPPWMRDYPVAPFPVATTTPSLIVEREKEDGPGMRIGNIYGGVNLAPADRDVRAFGDDKKLLAKPVSRDEATFVNLSREETTLLAPKITELARVDEPIGTTYAVTTTQGKKFTVAVMPGGLTRALAPNRQMVTDLAVPIGLGRSISLTRYYNSFFDPAGEFGKGWTFDLPQLKDTPAPVMRDGKRSEYRMVPHLVSPLGTVNVRFDQRRVVEPYGIEMPVAKDQPEIAGIAGGDSEVLGVNTSKVLFRNGTAWHFDSEGRLVLVETNGTATRYVWSSAGRVQQIVGYMGTEAIADIRLGYDQEGRIIEASASQADDLRKQAPPDVSKVTFEYGADGRLRSVLQLEPKEGKTPQVVWAYSYEADRLASIGGDGRVETSFGYNARGQLRWKKQGEDQTEYTVAATPHGTTFTSSIANRAQPEKWTYDERLRPVEADLGSGRIVRWRYGNDQEATETVAQDGKVILTRSTSPDGRTERTVLNNGRSYEVRKNEFGRPAAVSIDGKEVARMSWNPDGSLARLRGDETEIQSLSHENGWPNGVVISAPRVDGQTSEWLQEERDVLGRPVTITDSSGFEYKLGYDDYGHLYRVRSTSSEGKTVGADLAYNDDGALTGIESSWGKESREYTKDGALKRIKVQRQGATSVTHYDKKGHPTSYTAFDGGTTSWRYDSDGAGGTLRAVELPNGKRIDYVVDKADAMRRTQTHYDSAVVDVVSDAEGRVTALTWGESVVGGN